MSLKGLLAATLCCSALAVATADPSNAQVVYTSPAPAPGELGSSNRPVDTLAEDSESLVYGSWDFTYAFTPDDNLFVTRIFLVNLGRDSVGMTSQVDCGRAMFRHVTTPHLFVNGATPGTLLDSVQVNNWTYFDRNKALGRAMMRTCESAAR